MYNFVSQLWEQELLFIWTCTPHMPTLLFQCKWASKSKINDRGTTHLTFRICYHLYQSTFESLSEYELELQPLKQPRGTKCITAVSLGTMGELMVQLLHGQDGARCIVTPPPCSIPSTQDLQKLSRTREAFISSVLKDGTITKLLQQSPMRWLTSPDIHKGGSRSILGLP